MIHAVLIIFVCILGGLVTLMLAFVGIAYLVIQGDREAWFGWDRNRPGNK